MQKKIIKKKKTSLLNLKKIATLPVNIRWISISLFLFMIGWWLGGDTFFSIYVKSILGSGLWLTLIGTLLALTKLIIVIPVGVMNDQGNTRHLLLLGKLIYAISGLFYFLAGMESAPGLLILAVILNGMASSTMFTTYRTLYGKKSHQHNRSKVFGVYFSSINMAYVIGALLSAFLVSYIELPYMYLFVVIFALLSLMQDGKIQDFIKKKFSKSRKKRDAWNLEYEIDEDMHNIKKLMWKKGVIANFYREITSFEPRKRMFVALKSYGRPMYIALMAQGLVSFMNYVWFLFIPIIAIENNLSLPQIAILFAVMRLPYLINILIWGFGDKYSKKILITLLVLVSSLLYILLGCYDGFLAIVILSFWISLMIALLAPVTAALIIGYAKPKDKGLMSGLQEFVSRAWEIIWSLGFGMLTAYLGMQLSFIVLWLALFVLSIYLLSKKLIRFKVKDNEDKKEIQAQIPIKI